MEIRCTKKEFYDLVCNCEYNKSHDNGCEGCILYDGTEPSQCSAHLVSECVIVPESE